MNLPTSLFLITILIAASAFFSVAEISMAAARRLKLSQLAERGDRRAARVLAVQNAHGHFVTVVQIGLNTIAILGGVVGDDALSFVMVTALFIVMADLVSKRLGINEPEQLAMLTVGPMQN